MADGSALITGVAGFIGSHLAERCLALGWRVTGVDAFTDYYDEGLKRSNLRTALGHPDFELVEGDLLELELERLLERAGIVFHLAAQPGVRLSWDRFDVYEACNVRATHRLLQAARSAPVDRLVLASSSSVYGDAETLPTPEEVPPRPVSPYGVTKVATEQLAEIYWRTFGVPAVSLRYFTVYGPRQRPDMAFHRFISDALAGRPLEIFGDGEQTRDFTFVADTVAGTLAAAAAGEPGRAYNLGGGTRRSINAVLDELDRLLGRSVERVYRESQAGDARNTGADISAAKRDLGYAPSFDFATGLEAQLRWQRNLLADPAAVGP